MPEGTMLNLEDTLWDLRQELERVNRAITSMESLSLHPAPKSRRGRKSMGHEERLVVSERMRKYWADRRQGKNGSMGLQQSQ